jgi:general secretion pathway protein C
MMLSRRLRKNFDWFLAPLAAVVVLLNTQGIAQLAAANLGPSARSLAADPALAMRLARGDREAPFHAVSAAAILARNPFDSETGPLGRARAGHGVASSDLDADSAGVPPCDGVKVVGIVTSSDPDWSLAAFETAGAPATEEISPERELLRRRGGEVGALRVRLISWDRVWMTSPRGMCQAAMFSPTPDPVPVAPVPVRARPTVAVGTLLEPWIRNGIETVSATERVIDRALIPRLLERQAELLGTVRPVAEVVNGKVAGFRIKGVKADSLLGALGIVDGDRVETINGYDLTSPQSALEAYAHLQEAEHLTVQVNRGGSEVRLELDIR